MSQTPRLLLVDDEETFLWATAELLRDEGYLCDCATDGYQALDFLSAHRYQLLIADLQMPGNMQFELIEKLEHLAPAMPVILVTGYPSLDSAIRAVELPVIAYLIKPFDFDDLLRPLRKTLQSPSPDQSRQRRP